MKSTLTLLFTGLAAISLAQTAIPLKGPELFGSLRARHIGPALTSGRIADLDGHPTDGRILYAGTAGGGVWKTTDGGVSYKPVFDKHIQSIGAVAIDPKQPDQVVWVGTGECWTRNSVSMGDGIYRTGDGGQSWTNMGLTKSERISAVKIDPANTNTVYVGAMGALWSPNAERGVFKTTDGGKTWDKILFVDDNTGCSDLAMDPTNPNVLYAAFWEFRRTGWSFNSGGTKSGLYKTTDGGKTWAKIHNGFPAGTLGRIAVAMAPSAPNRLYAVIESEKAETKGLYRSEDAGATWARTNGDFELTVRPFYFSRIVVDPRNPDILLKGGLSGSISRDGGKTFATLGGMHSDSHDFVFDVQNSNIITAATDGGVYRSFDGGNVFEHVKGLPVAQAYQVSVDNKRPYNVYLGLQDNQSWYGPSESAGGIENRDWHCVGAGDGFRVYPHPTKPNILYSEMQGAENVWRFDTERQQTKIVKPLAQANEPKLRFNWNAALQVSPHQPDRLYVGSQFLHRSEDMGETWTKISPDLTTNDKAKQQQEASGGLSMDNSGAENHCTVFSIAESPMDQNMIWVGTDDGNVQVTTDGGKNWNSVALNVPGLPKNTWAYHVEPSRFDKNTCYVAFEGHSSGDMTPYVYKTTDLGKTWTALATPDIKGFARHIKEDLVNPNLLFLGTEQGLYVTVDGGQNWSAFTNNMPPVAVHYIAIQPDENDLVLATHGRGIIIIDDISPLRQLTNELLTKDVAFLKTLPTTQRDEGGFQAGGDAGEFVGENPSRSARITYFLKNRHTFGKMSMEIFDAGGKKVGDLVPGKAKGINIVDWNYRLKAPKVASGKTVARGAFATPRLPEGTYTVRLTKGTASYETPVTLQPDPKTIHSAADRQAQFETVMKLYDMTEQLGYTVDQLNALRKSTEEALTKDAGYKKLAEPLIKDLDGLKETLVVMKGDNYVDSAEPQLREKIANLLGEVSSYYGRPSGGQLASITVLETQLREKQARFEAIKAGRYKAFTDRLTKDKQPVITLRTFEEYRKSDG